MMSVMRLCLPVIELVLLFGIVMGPRPPPAVLGPVSQDVLGARADLCRYAEGDACKNIPWHKQEWCANKRFTNNANDDCADALEAFRSLTSEEQNFLCPGARDPACRKCRRKIYGCTFYCDASAAQNAQQSRNCVHLSWIVSRINKH